MIDYSFEDIIIASYTPNEIYYIQGWCDAAMVQHLIGADDSYWIFREYFDQSFSLKDVRLYTRWFTQQDRSIPH